MGWGGVGFVRTNTKRYSMCKMGDVASALIVHNISGVLRG